MGVDLETFSPRPNVEEILARRILRPGGKTNRAASGFQRREKSEDPDPGIGGIGNWNDAAEHIALGASLVQVCTAAMHYGFRIVEDMIDGYPPTWTITDSAP